MRLLVTGPALSDPGGVSAYYNAVLPELRRGPGEIEYLQIGGTFSRGGPFSPLIDQWRFRAALRRFKPDLVLCNPSLDPRSFIRDGLFVHHAARRHRVLVFFHGWRDDFAETVERRWLAAFRATFARSTAFIVLASRFRDQLHKWGVTAPIGLGVTAVSGALLEGLREDALGQRRSSGTTARILFLARLERGKGILETLEAFRSLREKGLAVTLTVAGDGGARKDVAEFLAANPGLASVIDVTGDVRGDRKRELLLTHDIYCFPSYTEGMPGSVLEAMAFGLPVVSARVGGLADFFEDGRMGRVLPKIDGSCVAKALEELVLDPDGRRAIGDLNHRFAMANFTATASARKLQAFCRQVLQRS
jgi:glycosyltransferase involved in cell wall biosynthesis